MTPAPGRITTDPDVSAADQARFFSGAVVPEMVFLARPGAPNQGVLSAAKLHLDLRAPIEFTGSYVFFVEQSLPALSAIVNGGAFALAAGDQVDYLLAPGRTAGDFAEMLPTFDLPAAPQLASIVSLVDKDPPRP